MLPTREPAFTHLAQKDYVLSLFEALNNSHQTQIRIHFRCVEMDSPSEEYATETICVSVSWFLMKSPRPLKAGSLLALRLQVPTEISGSAFCEQRVTGRVLSEHQLEDGALGYKVTIEQAARAARAGARS
ncbi:MAG: hypothetical protein WBL63_18485 [Candidatus Acidiferrum sp.]